MTFSTSPNLQNNEKRSFVDKVLGESSFFLFILLINIRIQLSVFLFVFVLKGFNFVEIFQTI